MEISLAAETIGHIGSFPITNSFLTSLIASFVLIVIAVIVRVSIKATPDGAQNAVEIVFEFLISQIESDFGSYDEEKKYFPSLTTIFLFVLTNNWLGLLPGVGTIGINEVVHGKEVLIPLFRSGNADLNTTIALAFLAVFFVQIFGILGIGLGKYLGKFFNFSNPIHFGVGLLEIVSEISRIVSFAFRLFGNIFAGEVLLMVIAMLVPYVVPMPFYIIELFFGFIQALVFTMLTIVFIRMATLKEH